jgi:2,4-dienoyl-CoA reductase-like NADH-dependent reductase (Old Yellow Enzyme family)
MTEDEIRAVTQDFVNAALLCKEAGVDGVQLHAAHGYLLSQFLSPCYNTRTDAYGGSIENRARLLFEVYDAVRAAVGDDYPIFIKINASDLEDGGLTEAESTWVCQQLDARGIDAVELSSGVGLSRNSRPSPKIPDEEAEGCFAAPAQALAEVIGAPVISVGGYRTPAIIERFLNEGNIAAIALCRPLIREPALAARWQAGDTRKADCISCSKCFIPRVHSCPQVTPME